MSNIKLTFLTRGLCSRCSIVYPKVNNFCIDKGIELDKRNIDLETTDMDRDVMGFYKMRALPVMYLYDGDTVAAIDPMGEHLEEAYLDLLNKEDINKEQSQEDENEESESE